MHQRRFCLFLASASVLCTPCIACAVGASEFCDILLAAAAAAACEKIPERLYNGSDFRLRVHCRLLLLDFGWLINMTSHPYP